jgi:hypothetical protein
MKLVTGAVERRDDCKYRQALYINGFFNGAIYGFDRTRFELKLSNVKRLSRETRQMCGAASHGLNQCMHRQALHDRGQEGGLTRASASHFPDSRVQRSNSRSDGGIRFPPEPCRPGGSTPLSMSEWMVMC